MSPLLESALFSSRIPLQLYIIGYDNISWRPQDPTTLHPKPWRFKVVIPSPKD